MKYPHRANLLIIGALVLNSCVMNTNVAVTKEAVTVANNMTVSERILNLFLWL